MMEHLNRIETRNQLSAVQNLSRGLVMAPVSKLEGAYWGDALGGGALTEVLEAWDGGTTKTSVFNKGEVI